MSKKLWIILLVIVLSFSTIIGANADEIKNKNSQLKNSKSKIESLKDKIGDIKEEKKELTAELDKIEGQLENAQDDINNVNTQIASANSALENTNNQLEEAIKEYNFQQDLYAERLRAMYISGPSGYLEVLLAAENFSDFISRTEVVKTIIDYDKNILAEMKDKQDKIEGKKSEIEQQKVQLSGLKKDFTIKKTAYASADAQKKEYYKKLEKDQKALEAAIAQEEKTAGALEKQIRDLQAQLASKNKSSTKYTGSKAPFIKASDIGRTPRITSPYGNRLHPVLKVWKLHTGVDYGVPIGTPIYAMADGEVIIAKTLSGYGKTIAIDHGSGLTTLYAHDSSFNVSVGDKVKKGQLIGKSGNTGFSTGPHVHFEVRINGKVVDPMPYVIIGD